MAWDARERAVLALLDQLVHDPAARGAIDPIVERVQKKLDGDPAAFLAWEPVPLVVYRGQLPDFIKSSWVFILRAGAASGAERHPNSQQRMMSYRGRADFPTGGEGSWKSHVLESDPSLPLERRWVSIPVNVWHQAVVPPGDDWVVLSFHTVPDRELIEERPEAGAAAGTVQRTYIGSEDNKPISDANPHRRGEVQRLQEALARVMKPDFVGAWLNTPNDALSGLKPLELVDRGEVDRLWRMIYELEAGLPT